MGVRQNISARRRHEGVSRILAPCLLPIWVFVLSACAIAPKPALIARDAASLQSWQARGRMAVAGVSTGGSGSFIWTQTGRSADVRLRGPVGIGSLHLTIGDSSLEIDTGESAPLRAEQAQAELAARLGAEVPAQALRYWLVGLAAPGNHEWSRENGEAILLQDDWRIDYQRYITTDGVRLPAKLVAVSGLAKVRIVVDRWSIIK